MKVETTIKYYVSYVPPRCRKPRYNEVTEVVTHNLRETTLDKVELAFSIDYADKYNIYLYNNKLYTPVKFRPNMWSDEGLTNALEELVWVHLNCSGYFSKAKNWSATPLDDYSWYETKADIIKRIKSDLGNLLVIDGVLYERCYFPYYQICTFGLGGNHGGTALMPQFAKRIKKVLKDDWCYSPYEFDRANKKVIEVATNRRDTDYVARGFKQSIACHISRLADMY